MVLVAVATAAVFVVAAAAAVVVVPASDIVVVVGVVVVVECLRVSKRALQVVFLAETMFDGLPPASSLKNHQQFITRRVESGPFN